MPHKALTPCSQPGCPFATDERYCTKHKKRVRTQYNKHHRSKHSTLYNTQHWRRARKSYLYDQPLCVDCDKENKIVLANVVDHKIPHDGNMVLFWDVSNWQSLCTSCHNRKTVTHDGGFGNEKK